MAANSTLLCIHRNPGQLGFLQDNGYELVTATSGRDGLQLLKSRAVDAVVIDYHLLNADDAAIAARIKQQRSTVPVVLIVDHMELPYTALESVDALVSQSDGAHFLLATLHFVLNVKPAQLHATELASQSLQKATVSRRHNTPI
jgi:CheY-like chemotaxis protein